ncbi:MAG: Coenzyme F420 hydrogenase/dehydrogenase, beta subunit C-terminal domain [Lachnospiraceae bacterium]|nr:Coenzyme F420 hydrogenase/dehydrogenase, beta subunit C-terminal domain [Lachnospiraceae bacterium]
MKHIEVDKEKCCGCGACQAVCPVNSIQMQPDELGFVYPVVQEGTCIECGKCTSVCQVGSPVLNEMEKQKYYAAQHKDKETRMESSSGGVFWALAQVVMEDGGCVYGAAFDENWTVRHEAAGNLDEVKKFRGSKYIQSKNEVYESVLDNLKKGRIVLYTGTPCQCQGILQYVNSKKVATDNLFLVDFVCHGVGSPAVWEKYVEWLEKKKGQIQFVTFRDKENGWNKFRTKILNTNSEDVSQNTYSYFEMYSSLLTTRNSCFKCDFTDYRRCSDLTMGDFWNIGTLENDMDSESGVSQVLVNTEKGQKLLENAGAMLHLLECTKKDCWQPHLEYPIEKPRGREEFRKMFSEQEFETVLKKYGNGTKLGYLKKLMVAVVKKLGLYVVAGKLFKIITSAGRKSE